MKRLYYFTDSYPFSVDYTWKTAEIYEAAKQFTEVIIVPFTFKIENQFTFPKNVRVLQPTLGNTLFAKPKYLKHLFSKTQPQRWLPEFFRAFRRGKRAIISFYLAAVYSDIIVQHEVFKELDEIEEKQNTVLFFQWTMNNALAVPRLKKMGFENIICRMHGFDLYEFRHSNYIPFKSKILEQVKTCTFISEHGRAYAQKLYPFIKSKSLVHYLGAKAIGQNKVVKNDKFHVLSISRVVPLKRLELIVESLKHVQTPIKWTHIGDGSGLNQLKKQTALLKAVRPNCEVEFLGWLSPEAINDYFSQLGINTLILVSETEGLPVVIMEAFSASIPAIATDVGGVSELVNQNNGILLKSNPEIYEIAKAIETLANESFELNEQRRVEAFKSYSASFNLERNSKTFVDFLVSQCR
jgi:colanic acid/amylovoran biosynthesis glycosyltransferase